MAAADFWRSYGGGFLTGAPLVAAYVPFSMVFGVVATEAGLDVLQTMAMTVLVIAGAAQFAAIGLLSDQAPAAIAILTGACVNLRMAMYSASLAPHWRGSPLWVRAFAAYLMHDPAYGLSIGRYAEGREPTLAGRFGWYFGVATPVSATWIGGTAAGAVLGAQIPPGWSLDFAVPLVFLAMFAPMLKTLPHVVAALTALVGALALGWLPYGLGVLAGGLLGMGAGALTEARLARPARRRRPAA